MVMAIYHGLMPRLHGRSMRGVKKGRSSQTSQARLGEALRRRAADWAAGAQEGKALDRQISRRRRPQERLDDGVELTELAAKLQRRA